jgi:hypothetical protein
MFERKKMDNAQTAESWFGTSVPWLCQILLRMPHRKSEVKGPCDRLFPAASCLTEQRPVFSGLKFGGTRWTFGPRNEWGHSTGVDQRDLRWGWEPFGFR